MPRLWLFDLDGTLVDSAPGIHASIDHALATLGRPPLPVAQLPRWIGPPLRQSFATVCADAAEVECAVDAYRARYAAHGWAEHHVYPGIPELLRQLAAEGARLAVVTSKVERYARQILDAASWGRSFGAVYGVGETSAHSEKAAQIAQALRDFAIPARAAVMVGDRSYDIEGAHANGVRGVGVLWGYGAREELAGAGADALAAQPADLRLPAACGDNAAPLTKESA